MVVDPTGNADSEKIVRRTHFVFAASVGILLNLRGREREEGVAHVVRGSKHVPDAPPRLNQDLITAQPRDGAVFVQGVGGVIDERHGREDSWLRRSTVSTRACRHRVS